MKQVQCDNCGEKLEKYKSNIKESNYCDVECQHEQQKNRETLECGRCGEKFERAKSLLPLLIARR